MFVWQHTQLPFLSFHKKKMQDVESRLEWFVQGIFKKKVVRSYETPSFPLSSVSWLVWLSRVWPPQSRIPSAPLRCWPLASVVVLLLLLSGSGTVHGKRALSPFTSGQTSLLTAWGHWSRIAIRLLHLSCCCCCSSSDTLCRDLKLVWFPSFVLQRKTISFFVLQRKKNVHLFLQLANLFLLVWEVHNSH